MKRKIMSVLLFLGLIGFTLTPLPVSAADSVIEAGCNAHKSQSNSPICAQTTNTEANMSTFVQKIIGLLLFAIGVIAVIMIIVGGIKYVTSEGDSGKTTSAKNTILYSVVGLVVALLAYAIVEFVINLF